MLFLERVAERNRTDLSHQLQNEKCQYAILAAIHELRPFWALLRPMIAGSTVDRAVIYQAEPENLEYIDHTLARWGDVEPERRMAVQTEIRCLARDLVGERELRRALT